MRETAHPGARYATAYNLFRRPTEPELQCAVAEDRELPPFITDQSWEFVAKLQDAADAPPGFSDRDAQIGSTLNGYYLFHRTAFRAA